MPEDELQPFPKYVTFETSVVCNANCLYCPQKSVRRKPHVMPFEMAKDIVDQCRGKNVEAFHPFLNGEPLLVPYLVDITHYIKSELNSQVYIYSNASLLSKEKSEELLKAGMDLLVVTVDSLDKISYERNKRGPSFRKVLYNLLQFIELRNQLDSRCSLRIQFIETDKNLDEWPFFQDFWELFIDEQLDKVVRIPLSNWGKRDRMTYKRTQPCQVGIDTCYITTSGDVIICCLDYNAECILGDIRTQTIEEVWNSARVREIRAMQSSKDIALLSPCNRCDWGTKKPRLILLVRRSIPRKLRLARAGLEQAIRILFPR